MIVQSRVRGETESDSDLPLLRFAAKESERSQVAISAIEFASTAMSFDSLAQEQSNHLSVPTALSFDSGEGTLTVSI